MTEQQKYIIYNGLKISTTPPMHKLRPWEATTHICLNPTAITTVISNVNRYEEALGIKIIRKRAHGKQLAGIQMPYAK